MRVLAVFGTVGFAFKIGLLNIGGSDPVPLGNITVDSYHGKQTTYDVTDQTTPNELRRVVPSIFESSPLYKSSASPETFSIAYARLTSKLAKLQSLRHNALIPMKENVEMDKLYQIRFVQIPGEEKTGAQEFAVGLSSIDTFASGWGAKSVLLGTQGNLQAKGAIATGFTDPWGLSNVVDWFVEVRPPAAVDIFIAIDDKPYGHAFHLDFSDNATTIASLRPIISFSEQSDKSAVIAVVYNPADIPKRARYRHHFTPAPGQTDSGADITKTAAGNWKSEDGALRATIRTTSTDTTTESLRFSGKIINTINMSMQRDIASGRIVSKTVAISTLMAGPAARMAEESRLNSILRCLDKMQLSQDGSTLTMACDDEKPAITPVKLQRYYPNPVQPSDYNPFVITK